MPDSMSSDGEHRDDSTSTSDQKLAVRVLMLKEVGAIIGKKADILRKIKHDSGAKIFISDASHVERLVTVHGNMKSIDKAFQYIVENLMKYNERLRKPHHENEVTISLIVPATQCGVIIGKGGSMIKEIKQKSGAHVRVSPDLLPKSTERVVAVTGNLLTLPSGVHEVCLLLAKNIHRGKISSPYQPHTLSDGASNFVDHHMDEHLRSSNNMDYPLLRRMDPIGTPSPANYGRNFMNSSAMDIEKNALSAIAASSLLNNITPTRASNVQTQKMDIPAEFVSNLFGRDGKIDEIKRISGATISLIGDSSNRSSLGEIQKEALLMGSIDSITIAKSLINMSIELQRAHCEDPEPVSNKNEMYTRRPVAQTSAVGSMDPAQLTAVLQLISNPSIVDSLSQPGIMDSLSTLMRMQQATGNNAPNTDILSTSSSYGEKSAKNSYSGLSEFGSLGSSFGGGGSNSTSGGYTGVDGRSSLNSGSFSGRSTFSRMHTASNGKTKPTRNSYTPY